MGGYGGQMGGGQMGGMGGMGQMGGMGGLGQMGGQYGGMGQMGGMGGMGQMGGGQMVFKYERATTGISHTGAIESVVTRKRNLLAAAQAAQAAANTAVTPIVVTPIPTSASSPTTSAQAGQRIALRVNGAPVAASDTK